jgi:hypothetical protein
MKNPKNCNTTDLNSNPRSTTSKQCTGAHLKQLLHKQNKWDNLCKVHNAALHILKAQETIATGDDSDEAIKHL